MFAKFLNSTKFRAGSGPLVHIYPDLQNRSVVILHTTLNGRGSLFQRNLITLGMDTFLFFYSLPQSARCLLILKCSQLLSLCIKNN